MAITRHNRLVAMFSFLLVAALLLGGCGEPISSPAPTAPPATAGPTPAATPTPTASPTPTPSPTPEPTPALPPLTFKDYTLLFRSDVKVVIGDKASASEQKEAAYLAKRLFWLPGGFTLEALVVSGTSVTEADLQNSNLMLVGLPGSNAMLEQLWAQDKATRVTQDYPGPGKGLIQIVRSPWNPQRPILIAAGSDENGLATAKAILVYGIEFSDRSTWVADMLPNPGNISSGVYVLYQDYVMKGKKTFTPAADLVINLDNVTLVMTAAWELTAPR